MIAACVSPRRTGLRILSSVVTAGIALLSFANIADYAHAQARPKVLRRSGPIDPVTHYPLWYEDTNGLRLGICKDPNNCFFAPPDAAAPVSYPTNWPSEMFYYGMNCVMLGLPGTGNKVTFIAGLEGAYLGGGDVAPFQEIVFSRIRLVITGGLRPNTDYQIDHPYGSETITTDETGALPRPGFTRDIGIGAVRGFEDCLQGDVGPFWVPTGFASSANGVFINPGLGLTTITSSGSNQPTNGHTYVRITDLGSAETTSSLQAQFPTSSGYTQGTTAGHPWVQFNLFTVQGQIPTQVGVGLNRADYGLDANTTNGKAVNIWASSATRQTIIADMAAPYNNFPLTEDPQNPGIYFGRVLLDPTTSTPPQFVRLFNLTDQPATSTVVNPADVATYPGDRVTDHVTIQSARYTVGGNLVVTASSSDKINSSVSLTVVTSLGNSSGAISTSNGSATITMAPNQAPGFVTVQSTKGGSATAVVEVSGTGMQFVADPVVANAGLDQIVNDVTGGLPTTVKLDGGLSIAPTTNTTYLWTQVSPASPAVTFNTTNIGTATAPILVPSNTTAIATFNVPVNSLTAASTVFTFDLAVRDTITLANGTIASNTNHDTVLVTVNRAAAVTAPTDVITITDARYIASKQSWRGTGTASVLGNQQVTMFLDNPATTTNPRVIGTAVVDALGNWTFQNGNGTASTNGTVVTTGGTVWARSDWPKPAGGRSTTATFTYRLQ